MSTRLVLYSVLAIGVLALGACGRSGAGSKASSGSSGNAALSGSTAAVNVKKFCTDYIDAVTVLQYGAITPTSISDLRRAQAEAPPAVKDDVTKMLNTVVAANNAKTKKEFDVTAESTRISKWGNSHC